MAVVLLESNASLKTLKDLQGLRQLTSLHLGTSEITNSGIKELMVLKQLESLSLGSPLASPSRGEP